MDLVVFQVGEQLFAVPAETVREIIDPVPVTPLPFVPGYVEGLVNVSGRVMPQICAMRRLKRGEGLSAGAGAIMVLASDRSFCALRINRALTKVTADPDNLSSVQFPENEEDIPLLTGELFWEDKLVLVVDPARLVIFQNSAESSSCEDGGLISEVYGDVRQTEDASHAVRFPAIIFTCAKEYFAFRFEHVDEVIESGEVTTMPGGPPEMTGLLVLRGETLPVFSMRSILFGGAAEQTSSSLVVNLNGFRVGLQVERVIGVQRFSALSLRPLAEEQALIEGFVTMKGERLVAMIRFSALQAPERFNAWRGWLIHGERGQAEAHGLPLRVASQRRLLLFSIGCELMALPLTHVERVAEYSEPTSTPEDDTGSITGIIQVQGNIIPVRTIESRMRVTSSGRRGAYLIVATSGGDCAIPVDRVEKVINMDESDIEPVRSGQSAILSEIGKYEGSLVSLIDIERLTS